jgi:hypothetical protein
MRSEPSLVVRVGIAKVIGLVIGLIGFFVIPRIWPGADIWFRLGFLAWYTTFGAMIGILGMITFHPLLKITMPFWFRGIVFGAWFNLVAALLAHEQIAAFLKALDFGLESPFWFVLEGAILGLVIDAAATRFGGEGKTLLG